MEGSPVVDSKDYWLRRNCREQMMVLVQWARQLKIFLPKDVRFLLHKAVRQVTQADVLTFYDYICGIPVGCSYNPMDSGRLHRKYPSTVLQHRIKANNKWPRMFLPLGGSFQDQELEKLQEMGFFIRHRRSTILIWWPRFRHLYVLCGLCLPHTYLSWGNPLKCSIRACFKLALPTPQDAQRSRYCCGHEEEVYKAALDARPCVKCNRRRCYDHIDSECDCHKRQRQ
jgi:hypothetical protein